MTPIGRNFALRLVDVSDAAFILDLRLSPRGRFLSPVDNDLGKQEEWIRRYKAREAIGAEYYFIVTHDTAGDVGTVRIYDVDETSFWWGSWIVKEDAPRLAALASACLAYDIGFTRMRRKLARVVIRKGNLKSIHFTRRFGARFTGESDSSVFFEITSDEYLDIRRRLEENTDDRLAAEEDADGGPTGGAQTG